jgi:hypothetical protein
MFDPKAMRVRFHELKAEIDALEAKIKPLRDKYDKMTQDYHAKIKPIIGQLKEAEKPLFDMKKELAVYVRALGGQTALQPGDK